MHGAISGTESRTGFTARQALAPRPSGSGVRSHGGLHRSLTVAVRESFRSRSAWEQLLSKPRGGETAPRGRYSRNRRPRRYAKPTRHAPPHRDGPQEPRPDPARAMTGARPLESTPSPATTAPPPCAPWRSRRPARAAGGRGRRRHPLRGREGHHLAGDARQRRAGGAPRRGLRPRGARAAGPDPRYRGLLRQSTLLGTAADVRDPRPPKALRTLAHMVVAWDEDWGDLFLLHLAAPDPWCGTTPRLASPSP